MGEAQNLAKTTFFKKCQYKWWDVVGTQMKEKTLLPRARSLFPTALVMAIETV